MDMTAWHCAKNEMAALEAVRKMRARRKYKPRGRGVEEIVKIGIVGILGALLGVLLKQIKTEYFLYVTIALCMVLFFFGFRVFLALTDYWKQLKGLLGENSSYFTTLLKLVGITYICECACGICRDAGMSAVATQIEILGKLTVLLTGIPILLGVLNLIREFV